VSEGDRLLVVREPRQRIPIEGGLSKAIEYHTQDLLIAKELVNQTREGRVYGNLGIVYWLQGDFNKAIEYHMQHLAIATQVGDRAGEGRSGRLYVNLGNTYQ
jgi:tetratricopeptide (TPR) repeat protein